MLLTLQTWRSLGLAGGLLALAVLGGGCASTSSSREAAWPRTGDPLVDGRSAITNAPAKDKVLWECRTAAVAMRRGLVPEAKQILDDVLLNIEGRFGNDRAARKSRSMFGEESKKRFLGEPYERVMAYYYRGIIYWMDGEPDNARACFRNAQLLDSDADKKEYASDYVLLDYLDGLATAKLAGDGSDALKRAVASVKLATPPAYDPKANVLFFLEMGRGPTKYATGEYAEELRFREGHSDSRAARITIGNQSFVVEAYDDLTYQATTRGGRVMDHILANKAVFKSATDIAGNVGLIGGLVLAQNRGTREAGLGLAAAGLISKIVSAATTPEADVRAWDNLPQYLSFASISLAPGQYTARIEFLDSPASPIARSTRQATFTVGAARKDVVIFVSDQTQ